MKTLVIRRKFLGDEWVGDWWVELVDADIPVGVVLVGADQLHPSWADGREVSRE